MEKITSWFGEQAGRLLLLVRKPKEFFELEHKEKDLKKARNFYIFILIVKAVLTLFEVIIMYFSDLNLLFFASIVISSVVIFGLGYLGAGALHLFARLFGGKGKYRRSFQVYVYGSSLGLLVGRLPVLSLVSYFFGMYLMILGVNKLHEVSKKRALLIFLSIFLSVILLQAISLKLYGS